MQDAEGILTAHPRSCGRTRASRSRASRCTPEAIGYGSVKRGQTAIIGRWSPPPKDAAPWHSSCCYSSPKAPARRSWRSHRDRPWRALCGAFHSHRGAGLGAGLGARRAAPWRVPGRVLREYGARYEPGPKEKPDAAPHRRVELLAQQLIAGKQLDQSGQGHARMRRCIGELGIEPQDTGRSGHAR